MEIVGIDWKFLDLPGTRGPLPLIPVQAFNFLHEHSPLPLYVVISGGIATGKTHIVRKYLSAYRIMDIDDYMVRHGYTDYDRQGEQFSHAMRLIDADIQETKRNHIPMVSMGTAANYDFLHFRLIEARQHGYETAVLQVRCSLEQALAQNAQRRERGEHHVRDEELDQIESTARNSAAALDRLLQEDRDLLGYLCLHDNSR